MMSRFQYHAVDRNGNSVDGQTIADSTSQAIARLERSGLKVQSISLVDSSKIYREALSAEERSSVDQLHAKAVQNAQSWAAPLLALSQEVDSRWLSRTLVRLSQKLKNATSIEQMAGDPDIAEVFPFVVKPLDSSSESDDWLVKLAQQLETRRNQLRSLLYPIFSVLFLAVILVLGAIWIVPIFKQMYSEFGLTLPAATRVVFAVSNWIYPNGLQTLFVLGTFAIIFTALWRAARKSTWIHKHFPILFSGNHSGLRAVGILCKNTAELLQLRYPLSQALKISAQGCNHSFYQSTACELSDELEASGKPIRSAQSALPQLLLGCVSSGAADSETLQRIGGLYRDRERGGSQQFVYFLSQVIIASAGLIVGFVAIALFMPLVRMVTSLA